MTPQAIRPPVIAATVPSGYQGRLYYRIHVATFGVAGKPLQEMITIEDRKVAQRLANVSHPRAAMRRAPEICDAEGNLLPDLRNPVKAKLKSGARKGWAEYSVGSIILVSARVHDVIESMAPGAHFFVPIDVADGSGGFRVYAFYCGLAPRRTALALKANGIPYTTSETGELLFTPPTWVSTDQFGYLEAAVMGNVPLICDGWLKNLFSQEMVERLGDVLPKGFVFCPMGLA